MTKEAWHKGYQEVKNVIHNEMGITKEEIIEIFKQIAKDEVQKIVHENRPFIYPCIREIIRDEMVASTQDHKYPKVRKNIWNYSSENSFKDYITGVMQEEIMEQLNKQFVINLNIDKK